MRLWTKANLHCLALAPRRHRRAGSTRVSAPRRTPAMREKRPAGIPTERTWHARARQASGRGVQRAVPQRLLQGEDQAAVEQVLDAERVPARVRGDVDPRCARESAASLIETGGRQRVSFLTL